MFIGLAMRVRGPQPIRPPPKQFEVNRPAHFLLMSENILIFSGNLGDPKTV